MPDAVVRELNINGNFVRIADLNENRSESQVSAILPRHHVVSQRRNSIQVVQLFGRGGAHHNKVADVAIVAGVCRRMSFFGAVRRMRTRIRLLAQPETMRSIVGATQ